MDPALAELLQETVSVETRTGSLDTGEPVFSAPTVYQARVQWRNRQIATTEGDVVGSSTTIYLNGGSGLVFAGSRVTLETGEVRIVLAVAESPDETGYADAVLYA